MFRGKSLSLFLTVASSPFLSVSVLASPGTSIFHTNGVFMERDSAMAHAEQIGVISSQVPSFDRYSSTSSELLFQDAQDPRALNPLDAAQDIAAEIGQLGLQAVNSLYAQLARKMLDLPNNVDPRISNAVDQFKATMNEVSYITRPELPEHKKKYKDAFLSGRRVVLVPHSQGNFFANEGYIILFDELGQSSALKKSIGEIGLATPLGFMADNRNLYATFANDWITCIPPTSLPANLPNAATPRSTFLSVLCGLSNTNISEQAHWPDTYLFAEASSQNLLKTHLARLGKELEYPIVIADFSAQQSDSLALADLASGGPRLDPTELEAGKSLYIDGIGLQGATFEIPGSTQRLSPISIPVPSGSPLTLQGYSVFKITIPASATSGAQGKLIAHLSSNGSEQIMTSSRSIKIAGSGDTEWGYYPKIFTINDKSSVVLGDGEFKCETAQLGRFAGGFLVGIVKVVKGKPEEIVPGVSWCMIYDVRQQGANVSVSSTSGSGIGSTVSHTTTLVFPPNVQVQTWFETAFLKQERLPDGTCKRTTHLERCTTQSYSGNPDYTTCPASTYVAQYPGVFDVSGGLRETVETGACVDEQNSSGRVLNDVFVNANYFGEATRTAVIPVN